RRTRVAAPATGMPLVPAAATAATAVLDRAPDPVAATRVRVPTIPRRELDESPRHKPPRAALAVSALLFLGITAVALALLIAGGQVKVPDLRGSSRATVATRLRRLGLKPAFRARHSRAPTGLAIAQSPKTGSSVSDGSTVRVVLSDGPPPVPVPPLLGESGGQASTVLHGLGLHFTLTAVPAPGVAAGIVTRESPAAGAAVAPGSNVVLQVAEQPRWRPLTSFSGDAGGHSVPFRIVGRQWRVVYSMGYQGLCTFVFFCSGPSARVLHPAGDSTVAQLDLGEGSGQTQLFKSGPGLYQVAVDPGGDTAKWSISVQDYY
ncbi:MAG: PASTA domain-containing protein, partial [Actinomycetota bacterium]|nr:PASTA domain-containing protein [Actinomycetota bacterium]